MISKSNITIHDIAKKSGVSISTVSLVLRNSPLVAQKTRKIVQDAMIEMGYVYNRHAASLRSRRTNVVGISVNSLTNPYFAGLASSIERALYDIGRMTLISDVQEDTELQTRFIHKMREYNVDGLLLCPAHGTDSKKLVEDLKVAHLPSVLFSRDIPNSGLDYAGYDHKLGMQIAVEHLIALGHRRIALLGGSQQTWVGSERLDGYRDALKDAGIKYDPKLEVEAELSRSAGVEAITKVLALKDPPTAAACANDVIAFGVMLGLRKLGLEPGKDFSVTGNDDVAEAELWSPGLTTVATDYAKIGEVASRLLLNRLEKPDLPPQRELIRVHLKVRESTGPLKKR